MKSSPLITIAALGIGFGFLVTASCYTQFGSSYVNQKHELSYEEDDDAADEAVTLESNATEEPEYEAEEDERSFGLSGSALYPEELRPDGMGSGDIGIETAYYDVIPPAVIVSPYVYYPSWYYWSPRHSSFSMHFGFGWGSWFGFSYRDYDPWWYDPYYSPFCYGFYDLYLPPPWWYRPWHHYNVYHGWYNPHYYGYHPWYYNDWNDHRVPDYYKKRDFAKRGEDTRRDVRARGVTSGDNDDSAVSKRNGSDNEPAPAYGGGRREKRTETGTASAGKSGSSSATSGSGKSGEKEKATTPSTEKRRTTKRETSTTKSNEGKSNSSTGKRSEKRSSSGESTSKGGSSDRRSSPSSDRGSGSSVSKPSGGNSGSSSSGRSGGSSGGSGGSSSGGSGRRGGR